MLITNIEDIIHSRTIESSRIEYKTGWKPERVAHTLCAFANDIENLGGGYIIIGISEENGMPKFPVNGISKESIDRINKELVGIGNLIEPHYLPNTEHAIIDGKDVLIIEAIVGPNRPYQCPDTISKEKDKHSGKSFYIRKMASTVVARDGDLHTLFEVSSNTPFDCRANYRATMKDIRMGLIYDYLSRINPKEVEAAMKLPPETVCNNLKILAPPPNDAKPLNAGLLFFNEKPESFIPGARIEVVIMPDPTGVVMVEKAIDGPIDRQIEEAMDYLNVHVIRVLTTKHPDTPIADRTYSYPPEALEEIITNAVYHKDYSVDEPVTITVRPDRIEVLSIPGPEKRISDEQIRRFEMASTRYRNARIGDLLKHRGLAEKRGTGIPTILRALEQNGSEPPVLETDAERTYFRVTVRINRLFEELENAPSQSPAKRSKADLEKAILEALRDHGAMTMQQLAYRLGYSRNASNLYSAVRGMAESGKVEYTHPDKRTSRNQMIRLKL